MGTFIGYALPGSFFVAFAVWWTVQIFRRYTESLLTSDRQFVSTPTFAPRCRRIGKGIDMEGLSIVVVSVIGIFVELVAAGPLREIPLGVSNGQHATMYFFFGLAGVVNTLWPMLKHHFANIDRIRYISMALAFTAEGLFFKFHLFGRQNLEVTVHDLLLYAMTGSAVFCIAEMWYRHNVFLPLARAYCTILQGTWLWQIAFILYNPIPGATKWKEDDQDQMMWVACIFTLHMAAIFVYLLLTSAVVVSRYRRRIDVGSFSVRRMNDYISLVPTDQGDINE